MRIWCNECVCVGMMALLVGCAQGRVCLASSWGAQQQWQQHRRLWFQQSDDTLCQDRHLPPDTTGVSVSIQLDSYLLVVSMAPACAAACLCHHRLPATLRLKLL